MRIVGAKDFGGTYCTVNQNRVGPYCASVQFPVTYSNCHTTEVHYLGGLLENAAGK